MNWRVRVNLALLLCLGSFGARAPAASPQGDYVADATALHPKCFIRTHPDIDQYGTPLPASEAELVENEHLRSDHEIRCQDKGVVTLRYVYYSIRRLIKGNSWQMVGNVSQLEHGSPGTTPGIRTGQLAPLVTPTYLAAVDQLAAVRQGEAVKFASVSPTKDASLVNFYSKKGFLPEEISQNRTATKLKYAALFSDPGSISTQVRSPGDTVSWNSWEALVARQGAGVLAAWGVTDKPEWWADNNEWAVLQRTTPGVKWGIWRQDDWN